MTHGKPNTKPGFSFSIFHFFPSLNCLWLLAYFYCIIVSLGSRPKYPDLNYWSIINPSTIVVWFIMVHTVLDQTIIWFWLDCIWAIMPILQNFTSHQINLSCGTTLVKGREWQMECIFSDICTSSNSSTSTFFGAQITEDRTKRLNHEEVWRQGGTTPLSDLFTNKILPRWSSALPSPPLNWITSTWGYIPMSSLTCFVPFHFIPDKIKTKSNLPGYQ